MSAFVFSAAQWMPRSGKDCRTCSIGRIKCDQSLPTCRKCKNRKLDCPGYGKQLQWSHRYSATHRQTLQPDECAALGSCEHRGASELPNRSYVDGRTSSGLSSGPPAPRSAIAPGMSSVLSQIAKTLPFIRMARLQFLLHHYSQTIAGNLVWIDNANNRWRTDLLPMAVDSMSLLWAILALGSRHIATRQPHADMIADGETLSQKLRDSCLYAVSQDLKAVLAKKVKLGSTSAANRVNSILATILLLCHLDVTSATDCWIVHLRGALLLGSQLAVSPQKSCNETTYFLMDQLSILGTFAATTDFKNTTLIDGINPLRIITPRKRPGFFDSYLMVWHETIAAHNDFTQDKTQGTLLAGAGVASLVAKFEECRLEMQESCQALASLQEQERSTLAYFMDMFSHAGLIYALQGLASRSIAHPHIVVTIDLLHASLRKAPTSSCFAQNMMWPLFIFATECRDDATSQKWIEMRIEKIAQDLGSEGPRTCLKFLQAWWRASKDCGECEYTPRQDLTWLGFAQRYVSTESTFLIW